MGKTVRLADIGAKVGVSTVTVSKALSGQKGVSEEVRARIIALADEMGYQREATQNQILGQNKTFVVLIAERYMGKYDSFYLKMYQEINKTATERGSLALLCSIDEQSERDVVIPAVIMEKQVQGVIVIGRLAQEYLDALSANINIPKVYVDFSDENGKEESVISDSYYGAYQITKYLLERGHRSIAYVGTLKSTPSITDRYMGYVRALMEYGIIPKKEWQIDDRDLTTGIVDEDKLICLPKEMPSAFFCNCDVVASMLIRKLEKQGLSVPSDVSVVGYDNYIYPGLCDLEITTYEVDLQKMAQEAYEHLMQKIINPNYSNRLHIVEGRLVEKDSVKSKTLEEK